MKCDKNRILINKKIKYYQVQVILLQYWDPIGVGDVEDLEDEYASYTQDVVNLFNQYQDRQMIFEYLYEIEHDFIGILTVNITKFIKL